jgi:hypothetical protein
VQTFLIVESMALKNSAKLHPDLPSISLLYSKSYADHLKSLHPVYTSRPLLAAAISVPFYYAAILFSISPLLLVASSVNSLIITLTSLVIFCFSLELYGSQRIAFVLGLIFSVCSFVLPYNTTLFPQPLQGLCLVTSTFFVYRSLHYNSRFRCRHYSTESGRNSNINKRSNKGIYFVGLAGLFLGLSLFAHPTSIIVIPGFVALLIFYTKRIKKGIIFFVIVLTIVLLLVGLVNYIRYGSFTESGYRSYASVSANSGWEGLVGLMASPGAGLILFFPPVLLLPIALKYMYRKNKGLFFLTIYIIVVNWLYFGTLSYLQPISWSGGFAWGPRYLISILPFITLALGTLFTHLRSKKHRLSPFKLSIIISVCVAGFAINFLGTIVWVYYAHTYSWEKEQIWKYENMGSIGNMETWDLMTWNPYYSPIILHMKILANDYVSGIQIERFQGTSWHYVTFGLVPCSYDTYILCKFGIIPIMILSAILVILAISIMRDREAKANLLNLWYSRIIKKLIHKR